jgi:hypothetical protein
MPAPFRLPQTRAPALDTHGLQPAKVGDLVPISSPDLTQSQPGNAVIAEPNRPAPPQRVQSGPRVEPLEPDTGFIKIQTGEKPAPAAPPSGPAGEGNPRPSISITITPGSK